MALPRSVGRPNIAANRGLPTTIPILEPERGVPEKILDILSIPEYAGAGLLREQRRREKGLTPHPFGKSVSRNVLRERKNYVDATGSVPLGIAMSFASPEAWIPGGVYAKVARQTANLARLGKVKGALDILVDETPALRSFRNAAGEMFVRDYKLKKELQDLQKAGVLINPDDILAAKNVYRNEAVGKARRLAEETKKELERLFPDPESRRRVVDIIESRPIKETKADEFSILQRWEEVGEPSLDKPHGLYLSPYSIQSPHREAGATQRFFLQTSKQSLDVSNVGKVPIRIGADDSGAGVKALKILNPPLFEKLTLLTENEVRAELKRFYPEINAQLYYDKQDMLEAFGGQIAKAKGYDSIIHRDYELPQFSEFVALTPSSVKQISLLEAHRLSNLPTLEQWNERVMSELGKGSLYKVDRVRTIISNLERAKIESGYLQKERAAAFAEAAGMEYVPRRMKYHRDSMIMELQRLRKAALEGDSEALSRMTVNEYDELIGIAIDASEAIPKPWTARLSQGMTGVFRYKPSFSRVRATKGKKVSELDEDLYDAIETDIANLLGMETVQTMRAVATRRYLDSLSDFTMGSGLAVPAEIVNKPADLLAHLTRQGFSPTDAVTIARDGFTKLGDEVPESMRGLAVPKEIGKELSRISDAYADPSFLREVMKRFTRGNSIWKGWQLSIYAPTHARNLASNIWNSSLAGKPLSAYLPFTGEFWHATRLLWKHKHGELDDTPFIAGLSEKEIINEALDNRVLRGGQVGAEFPETVETMFSKVHGKLRNIYDPALNPISKFGFQVGSTIEDASRLSHWLWRLKAGDTIADATKSVHKYLFDYDYGLTKIEQGIRNMVLPFYTWSRFNVPLQLEMLARNPRQFARFGKTVNALQDATGGPEPNEVYLDEWMRRGYKVRWRYNREKKTYEYFLFNNWWPGADLRFLNLKDLHKELLNMVTPFVKFPSELIENFNLFKRRPIQRFPGERATFRYAPGKDLSLDARINEAARLFRLVNEWDRTLYSLDRDGFIGMMTRLGFGASVYPANVEDQRKRWEREITIRMSRMKASRTAIEKRIARGEGSAADRDNVDILSRQIDEATAEHEAFK